MPKIDVTGKQLAKALAFPEQVELTREQAQEIISAALEVWKNGKPKPEEVAEFLHVPEVIKATQDTTAKIVETIIRVAGKEKRPERKLTLTRAQVVEAVRQLPLQDKLVLMSSLESELQASSARFFKGIGSVEPLISERLISLRKSSARKGKVVSLRGLWEGVDFSDEEIEEAKRSLFKEGNR